MQNLATHILAQFATDIVCLVCPKEPFLAEPVCPVLFFVPSAALRSQKRHVEATRVLLDYAQDHEEAIVVLLEAWQWAESLRVIHYHKRRDLLDSHFVPALLDTFRSLMETLSALSEQLDRQTARLVVVRENKMAAKDEDLLGGELRIIRGRFATYST